MRPERIPGKEKEECAKLRAVGRCSPWKTIRSSRIDCIEQVHKEECSGWMDRPSGSRGTFLAEFVQQSRCRILIDALAVHSSVSSRCS